MRLFSLLLVCAALPAFAQEHHHDAPAPLSAEASAEIARVERGVSGLAQLPEAKTAGYVSAFGWIPTMGEHWIDRRRMFGDAARFELAKPNQLMFSRVAGKDSLVGAAYAYFTTVGDTNHPRSFVGNPAWHEHADLAPPGQTLVMLHVWFVPSPDGPFAGTNPNLPFWAAGLNAPDATRMHDATYSMMVRRAGLAIADITDSIGVFPTLGGRPALREALAVRRDSVRAEISALRNAEKSGNGAAYDVALSAAAKLWDSIYASYLGATITKSGRERVERYERMLLGEHEH